VNIQTPQSSAATDLRCGGRIYSVGFCSLFWNAEVTELLELVWNAEVTELLESVWNAECTELLESVCIYSRSEVLNIIVALSLC